MESGFVEVTDFVDNTNGGYIVSLRTKEKFGYDKSLFGTSSSLSGYPGLFIVQQANVFQPYTYGLTDSTGKTVFPVSYNSIQLVAGGDSKKNPAIFRVENKEKLNGMITSDGEWIIQPKYDSIGHFRVGVARVCLNKKYGYINMDGKEVIPLQYDEASDFPVHTDMTDFLNGEPEYANVKQGSEGFFINNKGNAYFKGKGLKEAIHANSKWFIVRAANDSIYIIDKDLQPLTPGMNKIVTINGNNFLMQYGTKAYAANSTAIQEIPIPGVADVAAISTDMYVITSKAGEGQYVNTVMNPQMKAILPRVPFYVIPSEDLQLSGLYTADKGGGISLYSFINYEGKEYSDINP